VQVPRIFIVLNSDKYTNEAITPTISY